ncbi:hypothetical protein LMH66_10875 [Shewanella sp. 10N.7]|uniref:hypothetical protein n=1 Tax=Shewanella sp. 10N.7 TaxID=2885093 RepID=UPI001E2B8F7E|nr:hypothetical protein [Shewanella sp. 10N.7]MCC4833133.1 hypothetical protein [Shewanella sp. 10N.7]
MCSMYIVVIYGFEGTFSGKVEYEYTFPEIGNQHRCMLFLKQENDDLNFEIAASEIGKFGFGDLSNLKGNPLKVEVLNTESFKGFTGFYEEALDSGSSLVVYPNT